MQRARVHTPHRAICAMSRVDAVPCGHVGPAAHDSAWFRLRRRRQCPESKGVLVNGVKVELGGAPFSPKTTPTGAGQSKRAALPAEGVSCRAVPRVVSPSSPPSPWRLLHATPRARDVRAWAALLIRLAMLKEPNAPQGHTHPCVFFSTAHLLRKLGGCAVTPSSFVRMDRRTY